MAEEKQQETQEHEHYTPEVDAVVTVPHLHMKTYLVVFVRPQIQDSYVHNGGDHLVHRLVTYLFQALFMFNIAQVMQLASAGSVSSTANLASLYSHVF